MRAILAVSVIALGACAASTATPQKSPPPPSPVSSQAAPTMSVAGKTWIAKVDAAIDPRQRPRLELQQDGKLAGYTGCNTLGGTWKMSGDAVQIETMAMTKRACIGPGSDVESQFLKAVNNKSRITLEGDRLVALGPNGERMEFAAEKAS
jgi:putative lipoprotein